VNTLLRIAAAYSLAWAIGLAFPSYLPFGGELTPPLRSMAHGLAIANLGLAYIFNRAAADPANQRGVVYTALLVFGLRGVVGAYEVLYTLDGPGALPRLVDMVLSLAFFVGALNALPATLQAGGRPRA